MAHIKLKYAPANRLGRSHVRGNIPSGWGALTGGQMADRYWWALSYGIYCGHGETILHDGDAQTCPKCCGVKRQWCAATRLFALSGSAR